MSLVICDADLKKVSFFHIGLSKFLWWVFSENRWLSISTSCEVWITYDRCERK